MKEYDLLKRISSVYNELGKNILDLISLVEKQKKEIEEYKRQLKQLKENVNK